VPISEIVGGGMDADDAFSCADEIKDRVALFIRQVQVRCVVEYDGIIFLQVIGGETFVAIRSTGRNRFSSSDTASRSAAKQWADGCI
jgi:hypothetical protein